MKIDSFNKNSLRLQNQIVSLIHFDSKFTLLIKNVFDYCNEIKKLQNI